MAGQHSQHSQHSQHIDVLPLPELDSSQQGTSTAGAKTWTASVSNAAGYLCHLSVQACFPVPPHVLFECFTHPDNAGAFRDIKEVGARKVTSVSPDGRLKRVQVEQLGELRVLWMRRGFRTFLDVTEDARDAECLRTEFQLLRSDVLSRFHGAWELRPQRDAAGAVVGCHAVLEQDVLPHGVPSFFARLPVLGGLLRQVSLGTIKRLMEDIDNIVKKYVAAGGALSVGDVLVRIAAERGHQTILAEEREERLSDSEDEGAAAAAGATAGGRQKRGKRGGAGAGNASNGSSGSKASAVTSFAVGDLTESEEPSSEEPSPRRQQQPEDSSTASDGSFPAAAAAPAAAVAGGTAVAAAAASAAAHQSAPAAVQLGGGTGEQHRQHHHQCHHGHSSSPRELGVVLDVTEHGHVHVVLVPRGALQE